MYVMMINMNEMPDVCFLLKCGCPRGISEMSLLLLWGQNVSDMCVCNEKNNCHACVGIKDQSL
jgi:hypothetical protein